MQLLLLTCEQQCVQTSDQPLPCLLCLHCVQLARSQDSLLGTLQCKDFLAFVRHQFHLCLCLLVLLLAVGPYGHKAVQGPFHLHKSSEPLTKAERQK